MDGILDWYLVGVAAGLGLAGGIALLWVRTGGATRPLALAAAGAALAGGVVIAVLAAVWAAVAVASGAVLALVFLRKLSKEALPAALVGATVLAAVPVLGYVESVSALILGHRLGRRGEARYAGLRILARD